MLENASLNYEPHLFHPSASLTFSIKNTGFSPAYKPFISTLLFLNSETAEVTEIETCFDNRGLNSDETAKITIPLDSDAFKEGTYQIYFRMLDESTGLPIKLANESSAGQKNSAAALSNPDALSDSCILLGSLTVS